MHSALLGFGLGFFVALQFGPMSLFLVRSTLRAGWAVGLAIACGIAIVDAAYAAAGAAGAAPLMDVSALRVGLGIAGACLLVAFGLRTLFTAFRVRLGGEADIEIATPGRAFRTSLAGTASNPLTIASWAAVFAAASAAEAAHSTGGAVLLVAGVALGSLVCVCGLATMTALARRAIGDRVMRVADLLAGLGMLGFGTALGYTALRDR